MPQEAPSPSPSPSPTVVVSSDRRWWATPAAVLVLAGVLAVARPDVVAPDAGPVRSAGQVAAGAGVIADPAEPGSADAAEPVEATESGPPDAPVAPVAPGAAGTGGPPAPASAAADAGDRSHCTADGRQHGVVFHAPPCVARWEGADNGGATAPGVTARTIKVFVLHEKYDATMAAAYEAAGYDLAAREDIVAFDRAAVEHLNRRLELYGRQIEVTPYFTDCGYPEDVPRCRESLRDVIAARPFAVVFSIGSYSPVFDDLARAGILTVGAHWFDDEAYQRNRPHLYSGRASATRAFGHVAEYACAKLTGRPADRAGPTIHPSIGRRGQVQRRFGMMVPQDPSFLAAAERLRDAIARCDGGRAPVLATYTNDIATAAAQVNAIALRFINDGVTTVIPWNTSAAYFLAAEATRQRWYPEWIVTGIGRMDEDENGQRVDPAQWRHAFGPAMSREPVPFERSDATAIWRDGGRKGEPHEDTDRGPMDFTLLGWLLQGAGPQLTVANAEAGLLAAGPRGGGPAGQLRPLWSFGAADRSAPDDAREVWWDPDRPSPVNAEPGTYRSLGGRTRPGGWTPGLRIPVSPS